MKKYQLIREDAGNDRVYYSSSNKLYCIQNDGRWGRDDFKFYACSSDGEPSHEFVMPDAEQFDRVVFPE